MGTAFIGPDSRPHVIADWSTGIGSSVATDFVIDSGAATSAVDSTSSVGLRVKAFVAASNASGGVTNAMLLSGGTISVDVIDSTTGKTARVSYNGDVLLQGYNLMGTDALQATRLRMLLDMTVRPPGISLEI